MVVSLFLFLLAGKLIHNRVVKEFIDIYTLRLMST